MKLPQHLLALSRNEQRVVILIMLLLLAGTFAKYYRDQVLHRPVTAPAPPSATPPVSPLDDE